MLVMESLQSITLLAILLTMVFLGIKLVRPDQQQDTTDAGRASVVLLVSPEEEPEPEPATAHLRLVWSAPEPANDEPFDQMKGELAR